MKVGALLVVGVAAYESEWAEFQEVQGQRNGDIPEAFKATVDVVNAHNALDSTYKLSYTGPFAAMPNEEYKKTLGYKPASLNGDLPKAGSHVHSGKPEVDSVDWTTQKRVTAVKNQGQCGSCWAFSTTGGTEGAWSGATGNLLSLSEQQLVDCSKANNGCGGGLMDAGFAYQGTVNVASESSYAYTAKDGSCKTSFTTAIPKGGVSGHKDVSGESNLLDAVTTVGPVSVAIQADQSSFQYYQSGVLTGSCGTQLDHGVLAVGFGTESGTKYWKVKNSWGTSWGVNGYVLIERGSNKCGIASEPSYPTVSAEVATPYASEWAEFQEVQGERNGDIPEAFKATVELVNAHNALDSTYKLSYTGPFAAMPNEEYKMTLGYKPASLNGDLPKAGSHVHSGKPEVDSVDWTTQKRVTAVKNQGQCGSCWAFSTTGGTEGAWSGATGNLLSLSEQQLVDCSKANNGCGGGLMDAGFAYQGTVNVASESSYAYTAKDGSCKTSFTTAIPKGGVSGHKDVSGESNLLDAVTTVGPVSVAIQADQSSFQYYQSGVLTGSCGTQLDHGVLTVGFGTESGTKYWKVKNSWGTSWGVNGYVLIERGSNKCGIASEPSYPTVSAEVSV